MIKFFRKIRQRLLSENPPAGTGRAGNFSKYLLYAIGEIVLVVIGILIALNINNRNEERKLNYHETKILKELIVNLQADSSDHSGNMYWYDNASKSASIVVSSLESKLPWNDTMALHYGWIFLKGLANLNTSAYENLKSQGFSLISNDTIRIALTKLYTNEYDRLLKYEQEMSMDNYNQVIVPVLLKRLKMDKWWHATPLNYDLLLEDKEFREIVRFRGITAGFMSSHCKSSLQSVNNLILMIKRELKK